MFFLYWVLQTNQKVDMSKTVITKTSLINLGTASTVQKSELRKREQCLVIRLKAIEQLKYTT